VLLGRLPIPALACAVCLTQATAAQNWPQFRGPTGQGLSDDASVPIEWSTARNVRWKTPVPGKGWSSPVVLGDRVWLTTAIVQSAAASLRLLAFDVNDGHPLLNVEIAKVYRDEFSKNPKNSEATPTPLIVGDRVVVHFGSTATAAVSMTGQILWKTELPHPNQHGQGSSPVLAGGLVVINCDGFEDPYVVAIDPANGKTKWRRPRRQPTSQAYSTPLEINVNGSPQLVSVGAFWTTALEPATGREIWRVGYREGFSNVPRPVFAHGLVYITTGFQQPSLLAIRPDGTGDVTKTHVAWSTSRGVPYTSSPIAVGDLLYMVNDVGIASALDARTGDPRWVQRLGGNFSASPVAAGGRLYFTNEDGDTTVLAAGAEFRVLARNSLGEAIQASPAITGGSILIRTDTSLYRIQ